MYPSTSRTVYRRPLDHLWFGWALVAPASLGAAGSALGLIGVLPAGVLVLMALPPLAAMRMTGRQTLVTGAATTAIVVAALAVLTVDGSDRRLAQAFLIGLGAATAGVFHGFRSLRDACVRATDRAREEASVLRFQALHDDLTGLANRTLLLDRLEQARLVDRRRRTATGLLVIDLDDFKAINDGMGHAIGDEVLVQVALRLRLLLRVGDTAARLGGDEFVMVCQDLHVDTGDIELAGIAERVEAALHDPYLTDAGPVDVGASIGWTLAGPDEDLHLDMIAFADGAMLSNKRRRRDAPPSGLPLVAAPPTRRRASDPVTVVVVDDDPAMRLLAVRIIEASRTPLVVVGEAADGASAIPMVLDSKPDVVLCDVMMPKVDGPGVVRSVRASMPSQRFVFWSATTTPALDRHLQQLGVSYVQKDRFEQLPGILLGRTEVATPQGSR